MFKKLETWLTDYAFSGSWKDLTFKLRKKTLKKITPRSGNKIAQFVTRKLSISLRFSSVLYRK